MKWGLVLRQLVGILGRTACLVLVGVTAGCGSAPSVSEDPTPSHQEQAKSGGYTFMRVADLSSMIHARSNMLLVDARSEPDFKREHLLGATNYCFPNRLEAEPWRESTHGGTSPDSYRRQLGNDPGVLIVTYDEGPQSLRSHQAALWAVRLGFKNVQRLVGGLPAWKQAGEETRSLSQEK